MDRLQPDLTDGERIKRALAQIRVRYGCLDALVNNAGISMSEFNESVAKTTIGVNMIGAMFVTDASLPLLSDRASLVMVSSGLGELSCLAPALRARFEASDLSRAATRVGGRIHP